MQDYEDSPRKKVSREPQVRLQYIIWWRPTGFPRREYGPIYDKKVAQRDARYLVDLHGEGNAGWDVYNPHSRDRPHVRGKERKSW